MTGVIVENSGIINGGIDLPDAAVGEVYNAVRADGTIDGPAIAVIRGDITLGTGDDMVILGARFRANSNFASSVHRAVG